MQTIVMRLAGRDRSVQICCGSGALSSFAALCRSHGIERIMYLSNSTVWPLVGDAVRAGAGVCPIAEPIILPDGERYKNLKTVRAIYRSLLQAGADRKTALCAVGGGVVGDVGAFAASTFHRGMRLIHIPTTLLSQVDSSVGGKTGVNVREGKNLIGTFYQPDFILSDTDLLSTLPDSEYIAGLAEVIKAGLIADRDLTSLLEHRMDDIRARDPAVLASIIAASIKVKVDVVQSDERESGRRAILNFGHTLAHVIEKQTGWKIHHGYAVGQGMAFAAWLSFRAGLIGMQDVRRIIGIVRSSGLDPALRRLTPRTVIRDVVYDKKREGGTVKWVLLDGIGSARFNCTFTDDALAEAVGTFQSFLYQQS